MTAARMKMGGCKDEDVMATAIRVLHEHATATVVQKLVVRISSHNEWSFGVR